MNAQPSQRIRIALQKSGRLTQRTFELLERCGLTFSFSKDKLFSESDNFPLDLMLVRDDDIPQYVRDGVCELGIVGLNVIEEFERTQSDSSAGLRILKKLGFGVCRLVIALPEGKPYVGPSSLSGMSIATSYPATLGCFLTREGIDARIIKLSGSVEIAPTLNVADAICDLVSTGATLKSNQLKEVQTVFRSESALIQTACEFPLEKTALISALKQRIDGVIKASECKYIMMNAPRSALEDIKKILPGLEEPTVISLGDSLDRIAIHAVSQEDVFWDTMEKLKRKGASSILVVPIEKIID